MKTSRQHILIKSFPGSMWNLACRNSSDNPPAPQNKSMLFFPFAVQPPAASCYSPPPCFSQSLAQMVFCSCSCRQRSGKPPTNPPAGDPWPASGSHDRWWPGRDYYRGSSKGIAGGPQGSETQAAASNTPSMEQAGPTNHQLDQKSQPQPGPQKTPQVRQDQRARSGPTLTYWVVNGHPTMSHFGGGQAPQYMSLAFGERCWQEGEEKEAHQTPLTQESTVRESGSSTRDPRPPPCVTPTRRCQRDC